MAKSSQYGKISGATLKRGEHEQLLLACGLNAAAARRVVRERGGLRAFLAAADDERRARYAYVPERALAVVAELAGGDDLELPPPPEAEEEESWVRADGGWRQAGGELDELRGRRLNLDYAGGGGYAEAGQTRLCWGAAEEAPPHGDASQMQKRRRPGGGGGGGGKRGRW